MKLHSIDQNKMAAIIENSGRLTTVNYANESGYLMLIDSIEHYEKSNLDARVVYKVINDYLLK